MSNTIRNRILIIYTGGTIGSILKDKNDPLSPLVPGILEELMEYLPSYDKKSESIIIQDKRIYLSLNSFEKPIDSSNIKPDDWIVIRDLIQKEYENYFGFVVIHGTDTMAYTASALSFLISNLTKPIVITGSMKPIGEARTDGVQNLLTAIQIAAGAIFKLPVVPEVSIFFRERLLRGNRSTKISSSRYDGFNSPNYSPLGKANEHIVINKKILRKANKKNTTRFHKWDTSKKIVSITLFPGVGIEIFESIISSSTIKAVIIRTYGNGNAPSNDEFLSIIQSLVKSNKIVVNVCQTLSGEVEQGLYDVSSGLVSAGVISGTDLTDESAYAKLGYLLSNYDDIEVVKVLFNRNLRGEQTKNIYDKYFTKITKLDRYSLVVNEDVLTKMNWESKYPLKSDYKKVEKVYLHLINVTAKAKNEIYFKYVILLNENSLSKEEKHLKRKNGRLGEIAGKVGVKPKNFVLEVLRTKVTRLGMENYLNFIQLTNVEIEWEKCVFSIYM